MESRLYRFNNSSLTVIFGDIIQSKAEVIVSSDDTGISMGGGISAQIRRTGGEIIREDARKKLPVNLGDVVVSTAGNLASQKFIFHSMTICDENKREIYSGMTSHPEDVQEYIIRHSVDKCFKLMHILGLKSIAFPCIGSGAAHIPFLNVIKLMADAIALNLCSTQKPMEIELYIYKQENYFTDIEKYIELFEIFAVKSALVQHSQPTEATFSISPKMKTDTAIAREDMKHRVFISYSRKDKEKVSAVRQILDEQNIPYWIDIEGIYSGENYKAVIVDAIDASEAVIFISSQNSNESINVIREMGYAVRQDKIIIPLLLDDAPYAKSIRLDIADIDQICFTGDEDSKTKLLTSLAYALAR